MLLSAGCDRYSHLEGLDGAERDAERIFRALVEDAGDYDRDLSVLLRSPTMEEIDLAIEGLFDLRDLDILTYLLRRPRRRQIRNQLPLPLEHQAR